MTEGCFHGDEETTTFTEAEDTSFQVKIALDVLGTADLADRVDAWR